MSVGRLRAESRPHRIEEQVLGLRFCLAVASRKRRRDGRVAEGARLESVFRGNSNVGSNPTLSARNQIRFAINSAANSGQRRLFSARLHLYGRR